MLNPCRNKAFCFVLCVLQVHVSFSASLLSSDRDQQLTREQYIEQYKDIAIRQMYRYGIPASIILAQGCLESGNGNSRLAREANNHFGIKCHDWEGDRIFHDDDQSQECFRKYASAEDSYYDHSEFLRSRPRYAGLFLLDKTDYKAWAHGLKKAGYATNPRYAQLIIGLIEQYHLHQYDAYPPEGLTGEQPLQPVKQPGIFSGDIPPGDVFSISVERRILQTNGKRYVISAPGDTYRSLAAEYGLFKSELMRYNDVRHEQELAVGEKVYLERKAKKGPEGVSTWTTLNGETLHYVSQRFGIRLESLRRLNPGTVDHLLPGTVLHLR
ncbi:MAG: glucosaminidase domain-containing protein [Bacteroidales bacterium]|jgi:LysM repeat protein|nr:glucosaminidase domain-containing protein [Bacteroidales bacterium]MDD2263764.1 glucosaminidase domain-containing protein [Bacteroidales bacterium]MDD2831018.1 glucosaminidase domain-containing protein [Bacteroidales bacterium]MDD3208174.1 glucosaminidase domain-containing protein [Bacteroidales bacterium]MDD3696784.1 glucosaminidase domain-containing protein [Bacteroidales bacterium]